MGISYAVPACSSYPYQDYVEARDYYSPQRPQDMLLQYCSWSIDPICLLTNLLGTIEEKKLFIGESIAENSFDNIREWNENIPFTKYPPNNSISSTNIKDAWVSIAYIDPSVYDNGTYLINDSSEVLTRQGFTFVVDKQQLPGDCRSDYRVCGYDYSINVEDTGENVNAELNANSEYLVDRYHLVRHCVRTRRGSHCWYTCDYYTTQSFRDSISVSDSKKVKYNNFSVDSNYSLLNYYNGLADILISTNNSNIHFQIGNSSFDKTNYLYKIRYEQEPYNILVKELIPTNKISSYGLSILDRNVSSFRILAPYSEDCSLTIYDHFYSQTISGCDRSSIANSSRTFEPIETDAPPLLDSFAYFLGLLISFYILHQIAKKVIRIA